MAVKTIVQINRAAKSKPSVRRAAAIVKIREKNLKGAKANLKRKRTTEVRKLVAINKREIKKRDSKKKKSTKRRKKR